MMKYNTVRVCIWILGTLSLLGNLFVLMWRMIFKERNRVQSFLLSNLATADLLMGVYLIIIAIHDAKWLGDYFRHDIQWRSGTGCQITGFLSMLSSEVSVLILTMLTFDRLVSMVFVFKYKPLSMKKIHAICAAIWLFGIIIAILPITSLRYFQDVKTNESFYGHSAVCLPIQLSEERPAGFEYSVAIYIVLNFISFVFIFFSYVAIFIKVKRSSKSVRSTSLKKDTTIAKKLLFIILTDFCCWMPVIILGILSMTGNFSDPEKKAYVWMAVFVLPVNSAINPILYTFSTDQVQSRLLSVARAVRARVYSSFPSVSDGM